MNKSPWIQKVELHLCEECYDHLFYGESFLSDEKQTKFYQNYPDPENSENLWSFNDTFDEAESSPIEKSTFTCSMCETREVGIEYVYLASRIMNADRFEEFVNSANKCADYIYEGDSEWEFLRDFIKNDPDKINKTILYHCSVVNRTTENFQNFVENEKFINFVKEERNKKYKEEGNE